MDQIIPNQIFTRTIAGKKVEIIVKPFDATCRSWLNNPITSAGFWKSPFNVSKTSKKNAEKMLEVCGLPKDITIEEMTQAVKEANEEMEKAAKEELIQETS